MACSCSLVLTKTLPNRDAYHESRAQECKTMERQGKNDRKFSIYLVHGCVEFFAGNEHVRSQGLWSNHSVCKIWLAIHSIPIDCLVSNHRGSNDIGSHRQLRQVQLRIATAIVVLISKSLNPEQAENQVKECWHWMHNCDYNVQRFPLTTWVICSLKHELQQINDVDKLRHQRPRWEWANAATIAAARNWFLQSMMAKPIYPSWRCQHTKHFHRWHQAQLAKPVCGRVQAAPLIPHNSGDY